MLSLEPGSPMPTELRQVVRALDPETGERVWEFEVQAISSAGLLSTAGNVVFGGSRGGSFYALDARSGELLWRRSVGGRR